MTLTGEAVFQTTAANTERQIGIKFSAEGFITVTGANMRAALVNVASYVVDTRLTDINGHTWTFSSAASGIKCDMTIGETIESSDDVSGSRRFPVRISGFATMSTWNNAFATS
jgi:hypothetical protein